MSSSFLSSISVCDVFVSFRGSDTRRNFVSHLYHSMEQKGITIFRDTTVQETDTSFSYELNRAIGEAKVAVVVVSENYTSSFWCLEDLIRIVQLGREGSLVVIPIFYRVDPSDVRNQTGKLAEQFLEHEVVNSDKVQIWRSALTELAGISGEYSENWDSDADLIDAITHKIRDVLRASRSSDLSDLVGMDRHMNRMDRLLDLGSNDGIRKIGIWGLGGVGKTALARHVYEKISRYFDASVFIDSVRKIHRDHDPSHLRKELQSKLIQGRALRVTVTSPDVASHDIRKWIRDQRVLLVIDDVDKVEQLDALAEDIDSLGPRSKVIITTRDKRLLLTCSIKFSYKVECLQHSESLQLLSLCAFKQTHPSIGFEELSRRAVKLAGGIPSAIQAIGSRLYDKAKEEWDMILFRCEGSLDKDVPRLDEEYNKSSSGNLPSQLLSSTSSCFDRLVAMDRHMQEMYHLLDLESDKDVRIIAIWGRGGAGKTTLARYVFEETAHYFHAHAFAENADKIFQRNCPSHIEEVFLSSNLRRDAIEGLRHRKVLFVADGVDDVYQFEEVRNVAGSFGPGSRVIITSQNWYLLIERGVTPIYQVNCLRFHEALQLFYQFAFKQQHPPSIPFKQLSVRAIELAGYIPLYLKVLGSFLRGRGKREWERVLNRLGEKGSKEETRESRISYAEPSDKDSLRNKSLL